MIDLKRTRRGVLTVAGAVAVTGISLSTAGNVASQKGETSSNRTNGPITFEEIRNEGEWLVLHNESDIAIDISEMLIDFEFNQPEDQTKEFRDTFGTTAIPGSGSLTVSTGAPTSEGGDAVDNPDVEFDFGTAKMPDDGSDTYAILRSDGTVIARSDQDRHETAGETSDSALLPVDDFENSPTDLDGDGKFEDVNGDGEFDIVDVQALFENGDDPTIQNNSEKFDFNGDGTFDVADVQALFNELAEEN